MSNAKLVAGMGFVIALGAPLAALAGGFWEVANNEAGSINVMPRFGDASKGTAPAAPFKPIERGAISTDRQYVFLGEESGWTLRPMEYRFIGGRLTHIDDPLGHMERLADARPQTELQRSLDRSGGN